MISPRDYLRLDVEAKASGLVNLVQNPSGDLGGWGWLTPVAGTVMRGLALTGPVRNVLEFTTTAAANHFTTEPLPMAPSQYVGASYDYELSGTDAPHHRVRFEFLRSDKTLISSGAQGAYVSTAGTKSAGTLQAPALTAYVRLRFDVYSTTAAANPLAGKKVRIRQATVATAATAAALGSVYTNMQPNPTVTAAITGWTAGAGCTVARESDGAGAWRIRVTRAAGSGYGGLEARGPVMAPITPGASYLIAQNFDLAAGVPHGLGVEWQDAAGVTLSTTIQGSNFPGHEYSLVAPAGAAKARVVVQPGNASEGGSATIRRSTFMTTADATNGPTRPWDGATVDTAAWDYSWTGTAHLSTSTAQPVNVALAFIQPRTYIDVLDSALDLSITRAPLDTGTLNATVTDTTLDPAKADTIRPGRRARVQCLATDGTWQDLYSGRLDKADVAYRFKRPGEDLARISLTAWDANATLANVKAPDGVATIADLPYVLEGAGVPWDIDGSGNQVTTAAIVSANENASVLDQVAMTRDSALGYAWTDRLGILRARSSRTAAYYSGEPHTLDEGDYTDLQVAFSTASVINTVSVKVAKFNALTGETEEVPYGPYVDAASEREWGPRDPGPFTIHGVADVAAWANQVLAANAQPVVTVSSVTIPIRDATDVHAGKALLDLYAQVRIINAAKGIDQVLRVTSITHRINARRWFLDLTFDTVGSVATPTAAPAQPTSDLLDGVWYPLTLASPFTVQGGHTPRYMRKNGITFIRGAVTRNAAANGATVATLPVGYRPAEEWRYVNDCEPFATAHERMLVTPAGLIQGYTKSGTPTAWFIHTSFPAEG